MPHHRRLRQSPFASRAAPPSWVRCCASEPRACRIGAAECSASPLSPPARPEAECGREWRCTSWSRRVQVAAMDAAAPSPRVQRGVAADRAAASPLAMPRPLLLRARVRTRVQPSENRKELPAPRPHRRVGYAEVVELVSDSEIDGRPEIQRRGASQEGGWWVYRVNLQPHLLIQAAQASAISTWLALGEVCFRGLLLLTEREVLLSSRLLWPDL